MIASTKQKTTTTTQISKKDFDLSLKKNGNKYAKIIKILENTRLKWIEKNNREQLETERYDFNDIKNM